MRAMEKKRSRLKPMTQWHTFGAGIAIGCLFAPMLAVGLNMWLPFVLSYLITFAVIGHHALVHSYKDDGNR